MPNENALNDHDRKIVVTAKEDFLDRWIRRRESLTEDKVREGQAKTPVEEAILEAAYWLGDGYTVRSQVHLNNLRRHLQLRY